MEKEYVGSKNNYYFIFNFSYYFTYQGEQYEVNLTFAGEEIRENVEKYVQEYLKDDNIHVYSDEYVKISFFDYKNDRIIFQFSEYDNKLKLISTEDTRHIPPHNISSIYWKEETIEKQLQRLMEEVINMK